MFKLNCMDFFLHLFKFKVAAYLPFNATSYMNLNGIYSNVLRQYKTCKHIYIYSCKRTECKVTES